MGWVVLNPLIQAGVYGLVFGLIMPNSSRPENYPAFLVVGVFTFSFFSGCFADGAKSLISNRGMVRALHFPRAVLPLATVLQKMFELVAMVAVMAIIVMFTGETPDLDWLMIIPAYALMALFCGGVAFLAARLTVHMRDITQLIPFITRLFFYMSGIFFIIGERFKDRAFGPLLELNPLNVYISLIRYSMLEGLRGVENGIEITATTWALAGGYGVLLFVVGFLFFWQAEGLYGRD